MCVSDHCTAQVSAHNHYYCVTLSVPQHLGSRGGWPGLTGELQVHRVPVLLEGGAQRTSALP